MKQIFFLFLITPFLYINYKILVSDIQKKIIPNTLLKYLLFILPFFYTYSFLYEQFIFLDILLQIGIALLVSFGLYSFGIWSAGDAKYLLILGLFLGNIGILTFIGNIALITLLYLLMYCLYFYFYKIVFNPPYRKYIFYNISQDIKEKVYTSLKTGDEGIVGVNVIRKILKFFLLFLTLFVALRLLRMYVIDTYFPSIFSDGFLLVGYQKYLFIAFIIGFIAFVWICRHLYPHLRNLTVDIGNMFNLGKRKLTGETVDFIYLIFTFYCVSGYILYELFVSPEYISRKLFLIFSVYLGIFFAFLVLRYIYNITFQLGELSFVTFRELKSGEIIDKPYLLQLLRNQTSPLTDEASQYIKDFKNPIDRETMLQIKKIFKEINNYHKKQKTKGFNEFKYVKTLNTFAFGGYIFLGFILSYTLGNSILAYIGTILIKSLNTLFH